MCKKLFPLTLIALCISSLAFAQFDDSATIRRISNEIMSNGTAYDNLRYLCKQVGPRLSGSPQAQQAVQATMKMLKDAGADTVFLQPCMVPHWVRGEKEAGTVELSDGSIYRLHLCALGNSEGTGKKGLTAPVIEIRNFTELDQLGTAGIKGKIVFFNYPMNPTYIQSFMAYGESGAYRTRGPARAAKYGAVAVMVRSLASNLDDLPHTGVTIYNDSFPKIPAVAISTNDAEWLSKKLRDNAVSSAYIRNTSTMLPDALLLMWLER